MYREVKCRKCRKTILNEGDEIKNLFLNAHNAPLCAELNVECETVNLEHKLYMSEENIPDWIKSVLEEGDWSKGKICCQYCDARLGGFDFISGSKCSCQNNVLPNIYFVKSKIDLVKTDKL